MMQIDTDVSENPSQKKRSWWRWFSVLLAVVLIIIILRSISIDVILESLKTIDITYILLAFALNIIVYLLMAVRWRVLYNSVHRPPPLFLLIRVTLVSIFFNTILPSVIGGDTYRTFQLKKHSDSTTHLEHSFSIVFVDRLIGLVGLMLFGCFGILISGSIVSPAIVIMTFVLFAGLILILSLSMQRSMYSLILWMLGWLPDRYLEMLKYILERVYQNISIYRERRGLLLQGIMLSLLLRFCWFVAGYYVGQALQLDITLVTFVVFLPIIETIRMIPITIQGIGVREGLFILFFGTVGVTSSEAVLLATLIYLMSTFVGIIGGTIYLFDSVTNMRS